MIVGYTFHGGDLFHYGHLRHLQTCKKYCDHLIVGVLTDRALESYKRKPIISYPWRVAIYEAIACVDEVVAQNSRDPTDNLKNLKPDVLFHGDDWSDFPGEEWMLANDKQVIRTPYFHGLSTSTIIEQIKGQK